jgi:diguanylate cyclase (GGDEF)-like protein
VGNRLLHADERTFALVAIGLGVLGLVGLAISVQFVVRRLLSDPLDQLRRKMTAASEGNFLVRAEEGRDDEIGQLSHSFNDMLRKITELNANIIDSDLELDVARRELMLKATIEEKNRIIEATNARLEERLADISTLLDLSAALNRNLELSGAVERLVEFVSRRLHVDWFVFLLADEDGEQLDVRGIFGFPGHPELSEVSFGLGEGIVGAAFEAGQRIYLPDVSKEPLFTSFKGKTKIEGSFLALPARFSGHRVGVLAFGRRKLDAFTQGNIDFLQIVSNHVAMVVRNARMYERTKELATQDELTGLANRRHLLERMEHEFRRHRRFSTPMAVLMIDIDHFKRYNDEHGHSYGDEVLRRVARVLEASMRDVDVIGRYGGEEFAILLPSANAEQALIVADKLRRNVAEQTQDMGGTGVTISVGLAVADHATTSPMELIELADQALYRAKAEGRNRVSA